MNISKQLSKLGPPDHPDEDFQRRARVLYYLSISIGIATFIGFLGVIFAFEEKTISAIALSVLFCIALIVFTLSKTEHITTASIILLSAIWLLTTTLVSISGGMRSLDIIMYISGTALAGLLLGPRGTNIFGGTSILVGLIFLLRENTGITMPELFPFPARTGWVLLIINLVILMPAVNITINTLSQAIEQAHERLDAQKQAQEELRFSEEKFSKAFHASPMAIIIQRASDRHYIDVNEGFTKITGYTRQEAMEKTPGELNLYPDQERLAEMTKLFLEQGNIRNFEIPYRKKTGEIGHALVWGEPIEIGSETAYIAGTIDITERKQLEYAQANQAQEVATLYNALSKITGAPENIKKLSRTIADIIVNDFNAFECGVWLLSDDGSQLIRKAYSGTELIDEEDFIPMESTGLVTTAVRTKEIIYVPDVRADPRYRAGIGNTLSEFVVPLLVHGEVLGIINMESPHLDDFNDYTRRSIVAFAENAALALQNAKLVASLEQTVANLRESREQIDFFLKHTAEGVYRLDYDPPIPTDLPFEEQFRLSVERGKITECNDAIARMYGFSGREQMIGKPYIDFYGEEGYDANLEGNLQFYRDGYRSDEMETEEFNAAGEKVYFSNNVIGIIKDGYFVSTWGTQRDITPLKKALFDLEKLNQELEKNYAELKETQNRTNFFLEHTSEGVYRVDYDPPIPTNLPMKEQYRFSRERGRFGECNTAIAKMYGFSSRDEMLGKPYYDENTEHKEGYEASLKAVTDFYRNGYKADESETEEYSPTGEKVYYLNNAVGIVRNGYFMSVWGTQRDITPLKKALADLEQFNDELEQRVEERTVELQVVNKELEAFSYSVSHDLRAPLRAIRGYSDILIEDFNDQLDPMGKEILEKVVTGAKEMSEKIDGLLHFSRMSRSEINWQPINLSIMVMDILETLQAGDTGRNVTYEVAPELKTQGDPVLIRNVLENLLGNAWKYSSKNPLAHIVFGIEKQDDERVFFVKDNGAGFDMQYSSNLFGTFKRLHHADEFEGHGIGLATVQRIIHRHKGRIWAEAEEGKGATFYFTLGSPE